MTDADGGFYSAEDADSENTEGKFYVWSYDEILRVLGPKEGEFFARTFNAQKSGSGENILHLQKTPAELGKESGIKSEEFLSKLEKARKKLFDHRRGRIPPAKDDKILTDWNGLMISALAKGARAFGDDNLLKSAERSADFILDKMRDKNGLLFHRHRGGEIGITGMLDDYAFLVQGLLDIYEASAEEYPLGHTQALVGVDFGLGPTFEIVIAGKYGASDAMAMLKAMNERYIPNSVVLFREDGDEEIVKIAKYTENQRSIGGKATAYVCQNYACNLPVTSVKDLLRELDKKISATK